VSCVQEEEEAELMSRAELEARVRMELNGKLSCINAFLQRRSEHVDKIDSANDGRCDELRARLNSAELQLRVRSVTIQLYTLLTYSTRSVGRVLISLTYRPSTSA